jgi:hypothetical protein
MAFDLVILILCTYRLSSSSRHGGIATLLLRDGIVSHIRIIKLDGAADRFGQGYFCAVFGANLVQMIFAALALNPVMNLMCLPFALVVSTLASTTVFRNLYRMHDSLAPDTHQRGPSAVSGKGGSSSGGRTPLSATQPSSRRLSGIRFAGGAESYALESRVDMSPVEVRKVVEVDVESSPVGVRAGSDLPPKGSWLML